MSTINAASAPATYPPLPGSRAPAPVSTSGQSQLAEVLFSDLARTGKWSSWCEADPRLEGMVSLEDAVDAWQRRRDPRTYAVVAALTSIGSRRGGDDDDAALAVVLLLGPGIVRLGVTLRDVCEVDDVRTAVWEEVKLAEPQMGNLAARYLLQRARQRLTRPTVAARRSEVSLDQQLGWGGPLPSSRFGAGHVHDHGRAVAASAADDPVRDLVDVLTWAREGGVIEADEVELLVELIAAANHGVATEDAQRLLGERRGVGLRTIRRRRDAAVARLRAAAPAYLAATA
ncbi:hypothetical protein DDE18_15715 [Nocardioides gansuensis]|uniref:Uncharacterized protein n=1 Tax=Nocardioides gansuensis TaxID=2138300 RepID=A0A2T8F8W0_9ACTN|nr:hypothetical protein [Nocardioides gansuensis]PVG82123.1 hypothetical protein DDE18_15715 [Nocardioides gansuensis]